MRLPRALKTAVHLLLLAVAMLFCLGECHAVWQPLPRALAHDRTEAAATGAVVQTGHRFASESASSSTNNTPMSMRTGWAGGLHSAAALPQSALSLTGSGGSILVDGVPHELPWSGTYSAGTTVVLEAVPDACHVFWGWQLGGLVQENPIVVTMDCDQTGCACFCASQHALSLNGAHGSVQLDGAAYPLPWSISCVCGSTVVLEALPDPGYRFAGWSGDITADENPTSILVGSEKEIIAHFTAITGWPSLSVTGDGSGTVLVDGVAYSLPCSVPCDEGAAVALEATPEEGYRFARWSGDLTGTRNPTTIAMDDEKHVNAHFDITSCSIFVNARGEGTVALDGTTLQLPWTERRVWGTMLTLEAVPAPNGAFLGWSGAIASSENPVTVRLDGDKHVWADFEGLFTDVPACHWAYDEIKACAAADIVQGYDDRSFQPDLPLDRAAMAVFLTRALCGSDHVPAGPRTPSFSDVPSWHWAYDYVEYLKASGTVAGYCQRFYSPGGVVTRDQMAVFLVRCRAKHRGEDGLADFLPPPEPTFADVPALFWAHRHIEYLAQEGIVEGYPDGSYEPARQVTRAQMAVFVQRAFGLPVCSDSDAGDAAP
jgi:hypothetical protein